MTDTEFSMGCKIASSICSVCGKDASICTHLSPQKTNRQAHEKAAGMNLEDAFFSFNEIDPWTMVSHDKIIKD